MSMYRNRGKPSRLMVSCRWTRAITRLLRWPSSCVRSRRRLASSHRCRIIGWTAIKMKKTQIRSLNDIAPPLGNRPFPRCPWGGQLRDAGTGRGKCLRKEPPGILGRHASHLLYRYAFRRRGGLAGDQDVPWLVSGGRVGSENRRVGLKNQTIEWEAFEQLLLLPGSHHRGGNGKVIAGFYPLQGRRRLPIEGVQED